MCVSEVYGAMSEKAKDDFMRLPDANAKELAEVERLVREGELRTAKITENFETVGTIWFRVEEDEIGERILWIFAVSASREAQESGNVFEMMREWLLRTMEAEGCTCVKAETRRRGVFRVLSELGFVPWRVEMRWKRQAESGKHQASSVKRSAKSQ